MKNTFITLFIAFFALTTQAQKKKDLLQEIDKLRATVQSTEANLAVSEQKERLAQSKIVHLETQIEETKKENAEILSTMNNFTAVSLKKSATVESTLGQLKEKDEQLKVINDALTDANALQLGVLSLFKDALGGAAKVAIENEQVVLIFPNLSLFGEDDNSILITDPAKISLQKIATILSEHEQLRITVEGNSNAIEFKNGMLNNWDLSARQAAAIVHLLQTEYTVDPKRMEVLGKSEYSTSAVETTTRIIIDSKFDNFFKLIKNSMKKQSE